LPDDYTRILHLGLNLATFQTDKSQQGDFMQLPQTPLELIAGQIEWAQKNINNNLDFIPDDKLNWKPAPESKSILEIINHATNTVHIFTHAITGGAKPELEKATDREGAKALITQVVQAHQNAVGALTPPELEQMVSTPVGEFPKGFVASLPVVELINHHGQITYIQSLLGDSESHLIVS
jgi:uncharacterized damage-inducible protein DinB